jgi:hypothetical protein
MNDNVDNYVSLSLKNWAARNKPPADGLAKLMREIESPQPEKPALKWKIWGVFKQHFLESEQITEIYDDGLWEPLPPSKTWYAHGIFSWGLSH